MKNVSAIRAALRRRDIVQALGLWGTTLLIAGRISPADAEQQVAQFGNLLNIVKPDNVQKLFGGQEYGPQEELQMGNTLYGPTIEQCGGTYKNPRIQTAMRSFAAPLFKNSTKPDLPWEITVLDDNTVNAWALPGGKVGVNKGLLRYVDSDAELAAVVSHEMGHVEKSHAVQEMKSEKFTKAVTDIGKDYAAQQTQQRMGVAGGVVGAGKLTSEVLSQIQGPLVKLINSGYSRGHEDEADDNILTVFGKNHYDPKHSYTFFETLLRIIPADSKATTSLYSKHPDTQARINRLRQSSARASAVPPLPPSDAFAQIKRTFPTRHAAPSDS